MSRNSDINYFANAYKHLNETEKNEFSRIANKLLSSSFLCAQKESDRSDYFETIKRFRLFKEYFAMLDYELNNYPEQHVIQLKSSQNYNHYNLKLKESVVLLVLRKIYSQKQQEISLHDNIAVPVEAVHDAIAEIGWLNKRINKSELREMIRLFKRFSLVDSIGDIENDSSILILYPSILYAAPFEDIVKIDQMIKNYGGEEEHDTSEEDTAD